MQFTKTALLTLALALSTSAQVPSSPASTSAEQPANSMTAIDTSGIGSQLSSVASLHSLTGTALSSVLSSAATNSAVNSVLSSAGVTGSAVSSALSAATGGSASSTAASSAGSTSPSSGAGSQATVGAMAGLAGAMLFGVGIM